jgi:4-hydroxybutyrate CoA-transferase
MTRWIGADEVGRLLVPGMTVFVAGATAEPLEILEALSLQGERCAGVRFVSVSLPGVNHTDFCEFHADTRSVAFFATRANRTSLENGQAEFMRLGYSAIYEFLSSGPEIDLALVQLPPMQTGQPVSLGICADFLPAVLDRAGRVIGEINSRQPVPCNAPSMQPGRLDFAIACDREVPVIPVPVASPETNEIGRLVAHEIEDGSCIQVGIGAIPNAVLSALGNKNDLGCHSGMISEAVKDLARAGNITGVRKTVDTGKIVTGVVLGSEALVRWAGTAQELAIRPVSYTHDTAVISAMDRFISINTALEVDLSGRVNAESIGGRQVSGPGGAVDMMRGAAGSRGGKSFIALNSTAKDGQVSRIVPALQPGTAVTAAGSDTDFIVTEFGARRVRGLRGEARARALIEIAHPDFRDQLADEWKEPTPV